MRLSLPLVAALMLICSTATAETITSTVKGTVVPARAWDVSAEASNKIGRIHFIESQMVSKGDLLVEFDTLFEELELRLAEVDYFDAKFAAWMAKADHDVIEAKRDMAAVLLKAHNLLRRWPLSCISRVRRHRSNLCHHCDLWLSFSARFMRFLTRNAKFVHYH
jgi:multidrug resistance efflux pump